MDNYNMNMYPYPNMVQSQPMSYAAKPPVDPRIFDTPEIVTGTGIHVSVQGEDPVKTVPIDTIPLPTKKKRKSKKKDQPVTGEIVRGSNDKEVVTGTVEETPTAYTYAETSHMLRKTIGEIEALNGELVQEFTNVKSNKYIKNKYNTLVGLSENIGSLLNTKISAIRELNNSISKSNDLDFKKMKEMKLSAQQDSDDKYIADLYQSFISNQGNMQAQLNLPTMDQTTLYGSGIIRSDIPLQNVPNGAPQDIGYLNYMANMTPEQNMMRYENNPNIKQVVVFDAATGGKFFQVMDTSTGQVIPNVPVYDQMFMEDTTLDIKNKIAKNNNLHEVFPIVIINEGVTKEY